MTLNMKHDQRVWADIIAQLRRGELEAACEQLVQQLEKMPDEYAELLQIARVNQAELYRVKSEVLKGVLPDEEARRLYNHLTDKALQIIALVQKGKTALSARESAPQVPSWRYYLVGGLVALLGAGLLVWFYWVKAEECPHFGKDTQVRVLILPFLGAGADSDPALDLMDELNDWIERSPQLRTRAVAAVHRRFDIEKQYPNSAEAIALGRKCGVQMLVWGKVRKRPDNTYALDVRYRLINAAEARLSGDSIVHRLLSATEEAAVTSDPRRIAQLLFVALANHKGIPVLAEILRSLPQDTARTSASAEEQIALDTTVQLLIAQQHLLNNEPEKAIEAYDKVLEKDPNNQTARLKRGALYLQMAQYEAAARDLEAVPVADSTLLPALRQARTEAFLKTGQPAKARQELNQAHREGAVREEWVQQKAVEVQDSTTALEKRREQLEQKADRTRDPKARLGAAQMNLALGNLEKAARQAYEVLRREPTNAKAIEVVIEANLQKGDTAKALEVLQQAKRSGARVEQLPPTTRQLLSKESLRRVGQ